MISVMDVNWGPIRAAYLPTAPTAAQPTRAAANFMVAGKSTFRGDGVKTARERAEEKRLAKLDLVREQVDSGSLVIRKMTDEERKLYPPREERPKPRRWRG